MKKRLISSGIVVILVLFTFALFTGCDQILKDLGLSELFPTYDEKIDTGEDLSAMLGDFEEGMLELWIADLPSKPANPTNSSLGRILPVGMDTAFVLTEMTYAIDRTFSTVDSVEHEQYDSTGSAWIDRRIVIKGKRNITGRKSDIDHVGVVKVDSIAPGQQTQSYGGWGYREVAVTFKSKWRDMTRTLKVKHQWAYQKIHFDRDRIANPFPKDGFIDIHSVVHREVQSSSGTTTKDFLITSVVAFDGTRYARLEVERDLAYWIDLQTGTSYDRKP